MRTQLLGARRLLPPSHPGFLVEKEQLDIPDSPLLTVGERDTMRWGTESNWREGSQYFLVLLLLSISLGWPHSSRKLKHYFVCVFVTSTPRSKAVVLGKLKMQWNVTVIHYITAPKANSYGCTLLNCLHDLKYLRLIENPNLCVPDLTTEENPNLPGVWTRSFRSK